MEIVKVDINDLISSEYNPRQITDDEMGKLKNSIKEFGYIAPIIVNKHNNHIIGGNQRYEALKSLGYTDVDVIFVDEPDLNREKALNIALNKISGEWDETKLNNIFEEFKLQGFTKTELTGFNMEEILELELINDLEFNTELEEEHVDLPFNTELEEEHVNLPFNTELEEEHVDLPSEQDSTIEEVEQITCPHCGEKFTI